MPDFKAGGEHYADNTGLGTDYSEEVVIGAAAGATLRTNAGGPAPGQSNKTYVGNPSVATGATVVLETVATGKTLYITDIYVGSNTATPFLVQIQAAGTMIFYGYCKGDTGPISMPGIETQPSAASATSVQVIFGTAAATSAAFLISGVEQ